MHCVTLGDRRTYRSVPSSSREVGVALHLLRNYTAFSVLLCDQCRRRNVNERRPYWLRLRRRSIEADRSSLRPAHYASFYTSVGLQPSCGYQSRQVDNLLYRLYSTAHLSPSLLSSSFLSSAFLKPLLRLARTQVQIIPSFGVVCRQLQTAIQRQCCNIGLVTNIAVRWYPTID